MLATFFSWRVKADRRDEFLAHWEKVTLGLRGQGSLGSALFEADDSVVCAFACWPDTETRDRAFAMDIEPDASAAMPACIEESLQRIDMTGLANHWATGPR